MMELTLNELHQLESLLKKAGGVQSADYPFYGRIETIWVGDKIDRIDKHDQRKIERGGK